MRLESHDLVCRKFVELESTYCCVLIFSCVSNQTFFVGKGHIAWGYAIALVVDKYLHLAIQHNTDTTGFISWEL